MPLLGRLSFTLGRCRGPLPRFFNREQMIEEQRQVLNEILAEVDAKHEETTTVAGATAPLDRRRLRGIPAVGRGVGDAIYSTDPVAALLAKERSQGR